MEMQINIIIFGQLCEIVGERLTLYDVDDAEGLKIELNRRFPALANTKYAMAVDKKIVTGNIHLTNNCTVALLPPFSGG